MTVETMEDVVEGSGVELSADEEAHITYLRDKNISAKEVSDRIEIARNRSAPPAPSARPAPTEQMVSTTEVRKMLAEHSQKVDETARAREARGKIESAIGKLVDESGLTKRSKRRGRVVGEVFETLCGREDVLKLSDDDFQKVLVDETNKAITEEREDDGTSPPPSSTTSSSENDEGRKTAAEAMGQTNGNEPPPKSAAQTEQPRGNRVTAGTLDESFGAAEADWNLSDGEIEQRTSRDAEKFLRKQRGG